MRGRPISGDNNETSFVTLFDEADTLGYRQSISDTKLVDKQPGHKMWSHTRKSDGQKITAPFTDSFVIGFNVTDLAPWSL